MKKLNEDLGVDLSLGYPKSARMSASPNGEPPLDFSGVPSAADILAKYQPTDKPKIYSRTTAGETHPVGDIFAPGTNHPARQKLLKNPLMDDPYLSRGDKAFAALHTINRTDCYAGTEAESDAVFSGGGIKKHIQPQDTPKTYDGNLSEDAVCERMAETVVELMEAYPGVTIGEIFNAFFVVQHPDLSLGQVLEAFRDQFRESHVNLIVEQLRDLKATVAKAKTKIGTSKNLKSDAPKHEQPKQKFDAVSGSTPGHAIAVASSNVVGGKKKKQTNGISGSDSKGNSKGINESTTRYLNGRLPGF